MAHEFLRLLDELARRRGRAGWIEKTPRHLRYVPFLERLSVPERRTRFVHVIRDGMQVVASLHVASRSWTHPYDLRTCVRRWNHDVAFLAGTQTRGRQIVSCSTSSSPPVPRRLCSNCSPSSTPGVGNPRSSNATRAARSSSSRNRSPGRRASAAAFAPRGTAGQVLSEEQRKFVSASLRRDLYQALEQPADSRAGGHGRTP